MDDQFGTHTLSEMRAEFDQLLQDSLMHRFLRYGLANEGISTFPGGDYMQICDSAERPVLAYHWLGPDESPELNVRRFLEQAKGCGKGAGKGHSWVAIENSSVADYILQHVPAQDFTNLTFYYPVTLATSTARHCEEIPGRISPSREDTFADADVTAEFSCQATLNAAGMGNVVVKKMSVYQNRWITTPVPG
jgi:hypothetical protein